MFDYNPLPLETISYLSQLYNASYRHYHNINHINRCISVAEQIDLDYNHKTQLITAIWFHDAIYNPFSQRIGDNEKLSSYLAIDYCNKKRHEQSNKGLEPGKNAQTIEIAILATANHLFDQELNDETYNSNVVKYMLDIDLMGLADPLLFYLETGNNIRKEYNHISNESFNKGRMHFLEKMLQRKRIFYNDEFFNVCEEKARNNMTVELTELKGKQ